MIVCVDLHVTASSETYIVVEAILSSSFPITILQVTVTSKENSSTSVRASFVLKFKGLASVRSVKSYTSNYWVGLVAM